MSAKLLKLLGPFIIDLVVKGLTALAKHYKESREKRLIVKNMKVKKKRLKKALDKAYNGKPKTDEEHRELVDAYRSIIRD